MCPFFWFIFLFIMYNLNPALVPSMSVSNRIFMSQLVLNRSELLRKIDLLKEICETFKYCFQPFNLLKGDAATAFDLAATTLLFT